MFSAQCPIYRDKQLLIIHKINENLAKIKTITDKRKCTRSHICAPIIKKPQNLLAILCFPETTKEMNKKHNSAKTNYKSPQKRFFSKCWEIRNSTRRHEGNTNDFKRAH